MSGESNHHFRASILVVSSLLFFLFGFAFGLKWKWMNSKLVVIMLLLLSISGLLLLKYDFKFTTALYILNIFVACHMFAYALPLLKGVMNPDHAVRIIAVWLMRFILTAIILFVTSVIPYYIFYGDPGLGLTIFPGKVIYPSVADAVLFYACIVLFIMVQFFSYYKYPLSGNKIQ